MADIEIIEAGLSASLQMELNFLANQINMQKASVMVGAGFSKNAEMGPGVKMLDWNGLGDPETDS